MNNDIPENLSEDEARLWNLHFGPEGGDAQDTSKPAPQPQASTHEDDAAAAALAPETAIQPELEGAPGLVDDHAGTKWEERYKNAQALMTRATQDAARLRGEMAEMQRHQAAMLAEIDRLRFLTASPSAPPAAQPVPQAGTRQDTAPAALNPKLQRLLEEDPELVGPLVEQNQEFRRELDAIRQGIQQSYQAQWEQEQGRAKAAHEAQIRSIHPDVDAIANSADFAGWVTRQPPAIQGLVQGGSTADVVWLLNAYKAAAGIETQLDVARAAATPTTPRVRQSPLHQRPRFTRSQIAAMSQAEFARREPEIDEAMRMGLIF